MRANIDEELRVLEGRYWDAVQRKDADTAVALSDDACIVVGARGVGRVDREQLGKMLEAASYELKHYEFDDKKFQVRQIADDVAVVAYEVREDLIVDGKPESLTAYDASVWVNRDGRWLCALHTESLKGDPFGRHDVDKLHANVEKSSS
jgi:uncharacterized protein (TIGR02246 family)